MRKMLTNTDIRSRNPKGMMAIFNHTEKRRCKHILMHTEKKQKRSDDIDTTFPLHAWGRDLCMGCFTFTQHLLVSVRIKAMAVVLACYLLTVEN